MQITQQKAGKEKLSNENQKENNRPDPSIYEMRMV